MKLPPPDLEYLELETAKAFHYTWKAWQAEDPATRARLIAHELEVGNREAYKEAMREARQKQKKKLPDPLQRQKAIWGT